MKIPEGWPTREMVDAAWHEIFGTPRLDTNGTERITYALTVALTAAPTPPGIKLRDGELIDLANKAAPHNDRDNDLFYINMGRLVENVLNERFQAATPPAQEDEPVGYISQTMIDGLKAGKRVQYWILPNKPNTDPDYSDINVPIYTRPQADSLRKAAEEVLEAVDTLQNTGNGVLRLEAALDYLRAAMNK